MSVIISITLILLSLFFNNRPVTTGLIVGSAVSILLFTTLWWTITQIFQKKENPRPLQMLFAIIVFVFKLPVIGIALYFALRYLEINLFAMITGIGVTQIAIVFVGISNLLRKRGAHK